MEERRKAAAARKAELERKRVAELAAWEKQRKERLAAAQAAARKKEADRKAAAEAQARARQRAVERQRDESARRAAEVAEAKRRMAALKEERAREIERERARELERERLKREQERRRVEELERAHAAKKEAVRWWWLAWFTWVLRVDCCGGLEIVGVPIHRVPPSRHGTHTHKPRVLCCCVVMLRAVPSRHHPTIPPSHHPTPCIMSPALHACCTFAQERKQFLRAAANRTKSAAERRRELEKASRSHMHADESRGSASSGGSSQHHEKHPKPRTRDPFRAANSLRAHQGPSHMDGGDGTVDSALGGAIHHHGSLLARACWHGGLFSLHPTLLGLLFCLF